MNPVAALDLIFNFVRNTGAFVPRDYQTIGGMWTVDTYRSDKLPGVDVQLQDEGYTRAIVSDEVIASSCGGAAVVYRRGTEEALLKLAETIACSNPN